MAMPFRKTTQHLMPAERPTMPAGAYNLYPAHDLGPGRIARGYAALAEALALSTGGQGVATIEGYPGVLWAPFREGLQAALTAAGMTVTWTDISVALLPEPVLARCLAPYLGGDDPVFGHSFPGGLGDFFDPAALAALQPPATPGLHLLYGSGAALAGWPGPLVYVDVPKNEIQFRQRAGSVMPLGVGQRLDPKPAYKRTYFVDWPAANRQRAALLARIDWIVDGQRPEDPTVMTGDDLRRGLDALAHGIWRARPWFEPGPWGGQWIKAKVPALAQDVPNYAWSFELISPENGLTFSSDGLLLEVAFDSLMAHAASAVLGDFAAAFAPEFPIRYDFLDTVDGGNLSVQVHPRPAYIRQHFGERITQDETYYILDCVPGAEVNLGFQSGVDPAEFRAALETSFAQTTPVDMKRFVQAVPAERHALYLIPNGTIHGSGAGNLVLEISATPYIFTFKMYDWLRLDLDGRPRPLNIARAFDNLDFSRQGDVVAAELISRPREAARGAGWVQEHLPTHPQHFYDVHRYTLTGAVALATAGSPHVLSLVAGAEVWVETPDGRRHTFSYAETFVASAAVGHYRLISPNGEPIKVVVTHIKPQTQWARDVIAC
jgi:mannose-6-phosphate isomerase class I